jgi:hypothetical protein
MTPRTSTWIAGRMLAALLVLGTASLAAADHYPRVPRNVEKKDRSVLEALRRLTYTEAWSVTLGPGECNCLEETCEDGGFLISCGGEMEPTGPGLLTAVRRTSRETCLVCGCSLDTVELKETLVCLGF